MTATGWAAVLAACALVFVTKVSGYLLPARWLEHERMARTAALVTVALLAALVAVQAFAAGRHVAVDARAAALVVAVAALLLRAPFVVVVLLAAGVAAGLRALGWAG
jgi:hypothetical protein